MSAPTLKTKRLILRQWKVEDLIPFAKMNSDPRVMEFFPSTLSKEKSDELVKKIQLELQEKDYGLWAVGVINVASFIGFIGLHYQDFKASFTPCIEIAWRLAFDFWNKGYATEGAKTVIDYAFNTLNLKEIVSLTSINNLRSRKVMKKLHMTHNSKEDFHHPKVPLNFPVHVLYRLKNPKCF